MKKVLIVRFPHKLNSDSIEAVLNFNLLKLDSEFYIVPIRDDVERIEFDIVYDPHYAK